MGPEMTPVASIVDGAAIAQTSFEGGAADPRSYLLACYPKAVIPPMSHVVATAEPLVARVNHGIWITSCSCGAPPRPDIPWVPNAGTVVFLDVLLGWDVRCGNQGWGGGWRAITAPAETERRQIEAVLLCRPRVEDRNWEPGETIADLLAQNREHGDPVPDLDVVRIGPVHGPTWQERAAPFTDVPALQRERGPRWWRRLTGRR